MRYKIDIIPLTLVLYMVKSCYDSFIHGKEVVMRFTFDIKVVKLVTYVGYKTFILLNCGIQSLILNIKLRIY